MALDIQITEQGNGGRRVTLRGRLDTQTAPDLDGRLDPLLKAPAVTALLFDLGGLDYISSAGIVLSSRPARPWKRAGAGWAVARLQPAVRKVFDIVRALPSTDVFADDAEFDAYLDRMQERARGG